ncbi:MAG: prevent-host-death protein [Deltaproteobacteria bacterium]|nr:MAG: prevent-host-death protein [Deltaproteobacteria bacterium]
MRVFTYSEARQKLSAVLDLARSEEVIIKRRGGEIFTVFSKSSKNISPFDVQGIKTGATTNDILDAIQSSRSGESKLTTKKLTIKSS